MRRYVFDELPAAPPQQMREPPYLAYFEKIDVSKLEEPCTLYVYVSDATASAGWKAPKGAGTAALTAAASFAGLKGGFGGSNARRCLMSACRYRRRDDVRKREDEVTR